MIGQTNVPDVHTATIYSKDNANPMCLWAINAKWGSMEQCVSFAALAIWSPSISDVKIKLMLLTVKFHGVSTVTVRTIVVPVPMAMSWSMEIV